MNTIAFAVSTLSFILVVVTWCVYFAKIPRGGVPVWPLGSIIIQCVSILLAVLAIFLSFQVSGSLRLAVLLTAILAIILGLFFLWLLTQRKTPIGGLKVQVGDKLLPFKAATSEGEVFHSDELTGKRTLLKFFRGGW